MAPATRMGRSHQPERSRQTRASSRERPQRRGKQPDGAAAQVPRFPASLIAWTGLGSAADPRLAQFITAYAQGPQAPEPGASCSGGTAPRSPDRLARAAPATGHRPRRPRGERPAIIRSRSVDGHRPGARPVAPIRAWAPPGSRRQSAPGQKLTWPPGPRPRGSLLDRPAMRRSTQGGIPRASIAHIEYTRGPSAIATTCGVGLAENG